MFPRHKSRRPRFSSGPAFYQGGAVGMHSRPPWRSPCGWLRHAKRLPAVLANTGFSSAAYPRMQKQKAPIFIGAFFLSGRCGRDALAPSLALALRVAAPCKTASCRFGEHRVLISRPSPDAKAEGPDFHRGLLLLNMAVREGFEPSIRFHVYTLSRRAPSATRTPHHIFVSPLSRLNGALL